MLEILYYNRKPLGKILLITFISIIISGYFASTNLKSYLLDNWSHYRKKWYILPFSGYIKDPPKGVSRLKVTFQNFISIMWDMVNKFLTILMKPIYPVFKLITKIIGQFKNILDTFRKQFKIMRNFLFAMISKIYIRLQNITAAMTFFFLKLREGLKRQFALFKTISWTVAHSYYFMRSLVTGPIARMGRYAESMGMTMSWFSLGFPGLAIWFSTVCFDPDTILTLSTGNLIKMKDIKTGDKLLDGSIVKCTCLFDISNSVIRMYDYKGVIVSEDHLVLENSKMKRISETEFAKPIFYKKRFLTCLITDTGFIKIGDLCFSDYLDTHDRYINHDVHRIVETSLNSEVADKFLKRPRSNDLIWGFGNKNIVNINGKLDRLTNLKVGDKLETSTIHAIIHISKDVVSEYIYRCENGSEIYVTGNELVNENNYWLRVYQSKRAKLLNKSNNDFYINFITNDNNITFGNSKFKDFMESTDIIVNEVIDDIVDEYVSNETY